VKKTEVKHNLEELLVMVIPFVDLQGFIVEEKFIVKEVAVLKRGTVLIHYIFMSPVEIFDKIQQILSFLVECLSLWIRWEDGMVPYSKAKR